VNIKRGRHGKLLISLKKEELNYCLDTVEKALPNRSTIPVIENILLESDGNRLTFTATNLELDIRVIIPYPGGHTGKVLLPSKIVDIVRHLPAVDLEMNINWENFKIDLCSGQAKYNLFGADPVDYPLVQANIQGNKVFTMDQSLLKNVLKAVVFAASTDESRPAFNGVLFHFKNHGITLNASDTYRLVVKDLADQKWLFEEERCLIPAKNLRELLKIMDEEGQVMISPQQKQVVFQMGDVYFASRVLEEKYPDVSGVIPTAYKTRIITERKLLEDTAGRAALLAEGINQAVHFSIQENRLEIKVSSQIGRMEEVLQSKQEGEAVDVFVNSRFVIDILKVMDHKEVMIDFHGKNGPLVFRMPDNEGYLYLVLPIKTE
jgi:DNA polymerase III subunit beta